MTAHNQTDICIIPQKSAITESVLSPNFADNFKTYYFLVGQGVQEERIYLLVHGKTQLWRKNRCLKRCYGDTEPK